MENSTTEFWWFYKHCYGINLLWINLHKLSSLAKSTSLSSSMSESPKPCQWFCCGTSNHYRSPLILLLNKILNMWNGNFKTNVFSVSSLTEEAMAEVLGLTTAARDVWLALENSFSHISKTSEFRIKDDLQLIKRGTRSVTEYSLSFKALCDQLTAMGRSVDDTDKVHWYLRGLGADFAHFSIAPMSLTPLPAFKDLAPKAKSFEIFQKSLESSSFPKPNGNWPCSPFSIPRSSSVLG